ncbi:hypothetical protein F4780DRAFT_731633 [Xylariomycetidae sp. FL0641]|nr:hypothetical protein F4780DRAFT_731633 [Xylariomycetidae sp. FL0641]
MCSTDLKATTGEPTRCPDTSVVHIQCSYFRSPSEVSAVLTKLWGDNNFSIAMRNDMYIIRVCNQTRRGSSVDEANSKI